MIRIRPISQQDESHWRRLWRDYLAFYQTELPEQIFRTSFARLTDPEVIDFHGLLAESEDGPIGLVHYIFHRHGWKVENVVYLQDLYVAPEARGTGAGRALVEAVYGAADAAGCPSVYWLTQDGNAAARKLYDRVAAQTDFIKYQRRLS